MATAVRDLAGWLGEEQARLGVEPIDPAPDRLPVGIGIGIEQAQGKPMLAPCFAVAAPSIAAEQCQGRFDLGRKPDRAGRLIRLCGFRGAR